MFIDTDLMQSLSNIFRFSDIPTLVYIFVAVRIAITSDLVGIEESCVHSMSKQFIGLLVMLCCLFPGIYYRTLDKLAPTSFYRFT